MKEQSDFGRPVKTKVSLDAHNRKYVIASASGYSQLGYDTCYANAVAMADLMLKTPGEKPVRLDFVPSPEMVGTLECYDGFQKLIRAFSDHPARLKTWFTPETSSDIRRIIERYRNSGDLLRLFMGDPDTGRDYGMEIAVVGRIGLSGGIFKRPVLVEPGAEYGEVISTKGIVRMMDVATNVELYRNPRYKLPDLSIEFCEDRDGKDAWTVMREGDSIAIFNKNEDASEHVRFLIGAIAATSRQLRADSHNRKAA